MKDTAKTSFFKNKTTATKATHRCHVQWDDQRLRPDRVEALRHHLRPGGLGAADRVHVRRVREDLDICDGVKATAWIHERVRESTGARKKREKKRERERVGGGRMSTP